MPPCPNIPIDFYVIEDQYPPDQPTMIPENDQEYADRIMAQVSALIDMIEYELYRREVLRSAENERQSELSDETTINDLNKSIENTQINNHQYEIQQTEEDNMELLALTEEDN